MLLSSTESYQDVLGQVYMDFGNPNPRSGQFFTPWNIALCMAQMSMMDIEKEVHQRIKDALAKSPEGQAMVFAGMLVPDEQKEEWYFTRVLPAALPHLDPITVCDPCCGSGVMLLAAASQVPTWALQAGIVQFFGMDIDQTCVTMARINCMIYGLNSFSLKCVNSLTEQEMAVVPQPYQSAYREAQEATRAGDTARVQKIIQDVRYKTGVQAGLF